MCGAEDAKGQGRTFQHLPGDVHCDALASFCTALSLSSIKTSATYSGTMDAMGGSRVGCRHRGKWLFVDAGSILITPE